MLRKKENGSGGDQALTPLVTAAVAAGFPSPADDYIDRPLDLNEHLIEHPSATFFVRVDGESMIGAGIHHGDLLIVDRAFQARSGNVVIAAVDGELTVKRLCARGNRVFLMPENAAFSPIELTDTQDIVIWGVCRHVIHNL